VATRIARSNIPWRGLLRYSSEGLESSDEEGEHAPAYKEKKQKQEINGSTRRFRRKYKEVRKEKAPSKQPVFSNDDFPSLP